MKISNWFFINLFLCNNIIQRLISIQLNPLNSRFICKVGSHLRNFGIQIFLPYVILSELSCKSIEFLSFKGDTNHQNVIIMHYFQLLNSSVIEAPTVTNSMAIVHKAHQRNNEYLRKDLFLIIWRFKKTKKFTLNKLIIPVVFSENQRSVFAYNDW